MADTQGKLYTGPAFRGGARTLPARSRSAAFVQVAAFAATGPPFLDVPENKPATLAPARRHPMTDVFGCARMHLGAAPDLRREGVFGVTTVELG